AIPLLTWYDRPDAASTPARMVAASTTSASAACSTAAPRNVAGEAGLCGIGRAPPVYPEDVQALLIVNPRATSTTQGRRDVIARALASSLDLEVVQTRYRGHASHVAADAAKEGYGLVVTLGGDGTVNEAVNGLLRDRGGTQVPRLAVLPGG